MKLIYVIKWILIPPFFLGIVLVSLLVTEPGFRFLVNLADSLSGDVFSVEGVEGRLLSAWRLENIKITFERSEKNKVTVEIDELACSWRAAQLFKGTLHGEYIRAQGVRVWLRAGKKEKNIQKEKIDYQLPEISLPIRLVMDEFSIHGLSVFALNGSLEPFRINELMVKAEINGDRLKIKRLKLDSPGFGGELSAGIEFRDNWPLTLDGGWSVVTSGPGKLNGRINLRGDLEKLIFTVQPKAPFVAEINGGIRGVLTDQLHWQLAASSEEVVLNDLGLELPLKFSLKTSEFSGSLQTYEGFLSVELGYSDKPPVRVETGFTGNLSEVDISFLNLMVDESILNVAGRINWREGVSWQATLKGEQLCPELFFSGWPGDIELNLNSKGKWDGVDLGAVLHIEHLAGELRGFPLTGTGNLELAGGELKIDNLFLESGTTSLQVDGRAGRNLALAFQAASDNLAGLLPKSRGSFMAAGKLEGSRDAPRLTFDLNGTELSFKEYSIDNIEVEIKLDIGGETGIKADIKGSGISGAGKYIEQILVNLTGNQGEHALILAAVADLGRLDLSFVGGLRDEQWLGKLDTLKISSEQFGRWQTGQPAVLEVGRKQAGLGDFLLRHEQMSFSLAGGWGKEKGWYLKSELEDFSLQMLDEWGFSMPNLDGIITAGLTAKGQGAVPKEARLVVSLPDLILTGKEEDGKVKKWIWPENNIGVSINRDEAEITILSRFEDGSKGNLGVVVKNIDFLNLHPQKIFLSGGMETVISDLSFLAPLSNYLVTGTGGFAGDIRLSGTVATPIFNGDFSLVEGEIIVPALNNSVDELEITLSGDGKNNIVEVLVVSEGGRITMAGEINNIHGDQWLADIGISGENFKVVNLDGYQAKISPDIRLLYNNKDGISLDGTVTVPKAYIAPTELQRGAVAGSADMVVIDYEGQEERKQNLPLSFDLAVIIGESVLIDAFGLQGRLAGSLKIVGNPAKAATAFGNLQLHDGTFIFSDAELEISRGLIFYQGGAVTNPGLDIRAERKVAGKEVGVLITGTASHMEFDLFSNPPMDDSSILAYMVTGKKMPAGGGGGEGAMLKAAAASLGKWTGGKITDELEGVTGLDIDLAGSGSDGLALVVGKELIDGLYVSYGKNLTDSLGTFKARYDLNWGFSLETVSSAEETGTDLFWSWQR